ncbi:MAG: hypothetical protein HDS16_01285 [Bacteroides sp.]|nr:hypothetical protein [Bacteroidales bacterium]MBD5301625.1 hypothetical protein [Bacteroides sp.]
MRTEAARHIEVTKEAREKLEKAFGCTDRMIRKALSYASDTELARKIRYVAVKEYGAVPMCHYPECETLHDTTEDGRQIIRQVFNNGVVLRVDKRTGEAWITDRRGERVVNRQCVSIPELSEIQVLAENM